MKAIPSTLTGATLRVLAALAFVGPLPARAQEQPPPKATFKSSVDLVPVDVNVVDRTGRPVADLTSADFSLAVDGKPRKIASAEFISVSRTSDRVDQAATNETSNTGASGGRMIMIVVDQGNIGAARGRLAIDAASKFIGRLSKFDRVGLVTLPGAGPQIDFTANHALVQTVLQKVTGLAPASHPGTKIGFAEALAFQRSDEVVIADVVDRECAGARSADEIAACRAAIATDARAVYAEARTRTRDSVLSLQHVMERLAQVQGPKTVVFLSEGLFVDRDVSDVNWLSAIASRGQVTFYVLQLEPQIFEAAGSRVSPSRSADIDLAQEGLGLMAGMARGTVFRVSARADYAFNRLALELSGYYLLSFEPEPGDRDGDRHKIAIGVPGRRNIEIRARPDFAVTRSRTMTNEEMLAETLRSPLPATGIGLRVATYTFKDAATPRLRLLIASDIDRSLNGTDKVALAYVLLDDKGTLVSSQVEPDITTPIRPASKSQTFFGAVLVDPGSYTLKLAVVDSQGKRGSLSHPFEAKLTDMGQVHLTDLLIAEHTGGAGGAAINPAVSAEFSGDLLHGYLEMYSEAPAQLQGATATIEVASSEQGRAVENAVARVIDAPNRRIVEGAVPIALLPAGEYFARVVISSGGRKIGQVSRPFRVVRATPSLVPPGASENVPSGAASITERARRAAGAGPAIPFTSRIDAFDRVSVLAPQVVGFFLDRMNTGTRVGAVPLTAIDAARAGDFDAAIDAIKSPRADEPGPVFLAGLALYTKGDLEAAAGKFRDSLRIDSEFFPAAFYLGACYAAGGRDREAVGAWQTSLVTQSDAPFIYTLLGDALLRLREADQALDIMVEASSLWPDNEQVRMRLGTAQASAGKLAEAVRTLDPYIAAHPEDHERLLVALRAIYDARSAGKAIGTAEEDRQRFVRYAAAYAAAGGPQQALVEQWKKIIDR